MAPVQGYSESNQKLCGEGYCCTCLVVVERRIAAIGTCQLKCKFSPDRRIATSPPPSCRIEIIKWTLFDDEIFVNWRIARKEQCEGATNEIAFPETQSWRLLSLQNRDIDDRNLHRYELYFQPFSCSKLQREMKLDENWRREGKKTTTVTETRVENRSVKKQEEIESTWVGISDNAVGRHCFVSTRTKCTDRERERERERERRFLFQQRTTTKQVQVESCGWQRAKVREIVFRSYPNFASGALRAICIAWSLIELFNTNQ